MMTRSVEEWRHIILNWSIEPQALAKQIAAYAAAQGAQARAEERGDFELMVKQILGPRDGRLCGMMVDAIRARI